ncbi:Methyltransf-25 domain-containing protein [Mycena indigotica]|uniref:Methyltransf-25 domain-containing protein n=1 Tax=Mycena indigotica TaxID=2126181 RepID=A0A8H6W957_9AGAR|nr:Methyltransf-25 domain-containing protein [Mycena indigotica]KAF7309377.1 Methyltransf-25 domain-containing protein [Mycena indigotica]
MAGRAAGSRKRLDTQHIQLTPSPFLVGLPQTQGSAAPPSPPSPTQSFPSTSFNRPTPFGSPDSHEHTSPPWLTPYPTSPNRIEADLPLSTGIIVEERFRRPSVSRPLPPYPSPPPRGHVPLLDTKLGAVQVQPTTYLPTPTQSPLASSTTLGLTQSFSPSSATLSSLPALGESGMFQPWVDPRSVDLHKQSPYHSPPSSPPSIVSGLTGLSSPRSQSATLDVPRFLAPSTHSGSSEEEFVPRPTPFVYPSARTRARPGQNKATQQKGPIASIQVLPPGTPLPPEGIFTAAPSPPPDVQSFPPEIRTARPGSDRSSKSMSTITAPNNDMALDLHKSTQTPQEPQPFYFPSARTRAHPKAPGIHLGKGKKKEVLPGGNSSKGGFLGLGSKSRKSRTSSQHSISLEPGGLLLSRDQPASQATTPTSPRSPVQDRLDEAEASDRQGVNRSPSQPSVQRIGAYPLDSYDTALMESDRQTWELIRKLDRTYGGPSFHGYGDHPPPTVLDLGCGAGWWVLDAAMSWRKAGTQIVGFDMMDTMRATMSTAQRQGLAHNIKFVRGNFVQDPLPFSDGSFELVRMANLSLCIPHSRWEFVLSEVKRVLAVGGRLEYIDDHVFFPYGKPSASVEDLPIHGLAKVRLGDQNDKDSIIYNISAQEIRPQAETSTDHDPAPYAAIPSGSAAEWHERAQNARDLEALFENMLGFRFGIHPRPAEFVFELLRRVFGGVKEIATMHLTLAPSEHHIDDEEQHSEQDDVLVQSPGLILWPSTVVPMTPTELEANTSKHQRLLLSCKTVLADYAAEVTDDGDDDDAARDATMEALWEYHNFLRDRFNPPTTYDSLGTADETTSLYSEELDDIAEYQSELQTHYEWASEPATPQPLPSPAITLTSPVIPTTSPRTALAPIPPHLVVPPPPTSPPPVPPPITQPIRPPLSSISHPIIQPPSPSFSTRKTSLKSPVVRGRARAPSMISTHTTAPPYSRVELTHVRTFHVYEAIKHSDGRFPITVKNKSSAQLTSTSQ